MKSKGQKEKKIVVMKWSNNVVLNTSLLKNKESTNKESKNMKNNEKWKETEKRRLCCWLSDRRLDFVEMSFLEEEEANSGDFGHPRRLWSLCDTTSRALRWEANSFTSTKLSSLTNCRRPADLMHSI